MNVYETKPFHKLCIVAVNKEAFLLHVFWVHRVPLVIDYSRHAEIFHFQLQYVCENLLRLLNIISIVGQGSRNCTIEKRLENLLNISKKI